NTFL
ncbi:unnamed protein product, partial [Diplocarpon coronariae]